jgi:PTS system N-acetylglucosamine-specific IIC component
MMFGLPAACLAMYRTAKPENRATVGGVLLSMALTSFLTGVTEPIEFSFMFLAPLLYAIHAVLTGLSMALMSYLDVHLGFTFSAGLFDYALSFGKSKNSLLMLPVGIAYFIAYYSIFVFFIRKFDLMTMGREDMSITQERPSDGIVPDRAQGFVKALGGASNLVSVDACTTRLRLQVQDNSKVDEAALKALGARGIIKPAAGSVQVILGPIADIISDEIRRFLATGSTVTNTRTDNTAQLIAPTSEADGSAWISALGGIGNVRQVEAVAGTRLRVSVAHAEKIDQNSLNALGVAGVQIFCNELAHVILASNAQPVAIAINKIFDNKAG